MTPTDAGNHSTAIVAPVPSKLGRLWYRCFHAFCAHFYFDRITLVHPERIPAHGPTLFLALHRNGAVDGFVYRAVLPETLFLISTQLRRHPLGQLFFTGIEVVRNKDDGDRQINAGAMQKCRAWLEFGGCLCVFPEGTSSLGPKHLPFKSGAIHLILDYLAANASQSTLNVIPLGIHYESPTQFRGRVEVVAGMAIDLDFDSSLSPLARIKEMKRRVTSGLEAVGINVTSAEYQDKIERMARHQRQLDGTSYFESLKQLENQTSGSSRRQETPTAFPHVPCSSRREETLTSTLCDSLRLCGKLILFFLCTPIVLAAASLNAPPLAAAYLVSRQMADDRNVISLWKMLVGIPSWIFWCSAVIVATLLVNEAWLLVVYLVITVTGIKSYAFVREISQMKKAR